MKRIFLNLKAFSLITLLGLAASCSSDDDNTGVVGPEPEEARMITIAAARMGDNPGDGNGGTLIYSVTSVPPAVISTVFMCFQLRNIVMLRDWNPPAAKAKEE